MIALHTDLKGKQVILVGAGGHGRVVLELAIACGADVLGVCDPALQAEGVETWNGCKVLGGDEYLGTVRPRDVQLLNGIGKMPGAALRAALYERFMAEGFTFPALVHPAAWVSQSAFLEPGAQVMAGAIIQPGARVGTNSIVNTRSSIDHDSTVGMHCHIAPGATLCGGVRVGDRVFIGAGATLVQEVSVAADAFVRAGSLVTNDVL